MAIYLVTYDLNNEVRRPNITKEIDKTDWAQLSESSYAIQTSETVAQVYARFQKYLDIDDQLYVITLTRPWTGHGPKAVNQWLAQRLGPAG
jgi:CRISPR/Cas system-associated endoribonuclease Cas2